MNDTTVIEIATLTMEVALKLSAPILLTALSVGFTVSLFQSMTQIQEFTLAFVPKVVAVGAELRAPESARAGAPVAVGWDGPAYQGDYIAVSRPGDEGYEKYTYTREGSPLILQMPTEPGTYELRYVATGDGTVILTRKDIKLEEVTATLAAADTAPAGGKLAVDWEGPDYRGDFIGLVGAGGIGQELKVAFDLFQYRNASAIILAIFAIVLVMEYFTDRLRARFE